MDMADLSHLLGDVYGDDPDGTGAGVQPPADDRGGAPDWADESALDAAFANWTPGPPPDAPAAERDVFATGEPAGAAPLPDDLAAALSEALVGAPVATSTLPAPEPVERAPLDPAPLDPAPLDVSGSWADLAASRRSAVLASADAFAGAAALTGHLPWQRGDDDILPRRTSSPRRARGGLSFRRR
jgi:hypothetical protein